MDGNHEREQEIFDACLGLTPPQRDNYLRRTCLGDDQLQARIERLLAAHARAEERTLQPFRDLSLEELPDLIGPYRLIGVLGEGGMGVVYDAEQMEPVRRRVALKIVKLGMDTRQVVTRFMTERQALASLDHPYVAKVLDAGQTVSGRPYFVMERVDGVPLLEYCDRNGLSISQRVELVALVCQAVQHAHQKGVIHRDLKPSNILVSSSDGVPLPKIIDFGIAKAVGLDQPVNVTEFTRAGQALGTPAYMSPEQAGRGAQDVDTRTDVYSLGVILYEVLTGSLPVDPARTGSAEFLVALERGDVQPPKPSARIASAASDELSLRRGATLAGLRRQLEGDLDWICMKALEVERDRRYDTPIALAEDLRRHLGHEPVSAGPPSRKYRLGRMVRRNRTTVVAAAVAMVALVAGAAAAIAQAVRATRAEQASRADAETARQVADFMVNLFEVSDPGRAKGGTVTARELLDRGADRIRGDLEDQPLVRARVQSVVGEIYRKLGLYDPAGPLLEEALSAREKLLGPDNVETVQTLSSIGRLRFERGDRSGAEAAFRSALSRLATVPDADRVAEARLQAELAGVLRASARFAEAEALIRQALDTFIRELGPTHETVGLAWGTLGSVLSGQTKLGDAEAAFKAGIAINEVALGDDHPELATTLHNLAVLLGRQGRDREAEPHLRRAAAVFEKAYGPRHVTVADSLTSLAASYGRQGRLDESEATTLKAMAVREAIFGPDHPDTVVELKNLGLTRLLKADYVGAQQAFVRNLEIERKAFGPDHPRVAWTESRLGGLHMRLGQWDEAEAAYRRALAATEKTLGPDHIDTAANLRSLGRVALRRGRLVDAERFLMRALAIAGKNPSHADSPNTLKAVGELRRRQGRLDEARKSIEEALASERKIFRAGHPIFGETYVALADVLAAQGNPRGAEPLYRQAVTVAETALGPNHPDVARALHGLGALLADAGTRRDALACLERALAIRSARLGKANPDTAETARLHAAVRGTALR